MTKRGGSQPNQNVGHSPGQLTLFLKKQMTFKWEEEQLQIKRDLGDIQATVTCGPQEDPDSN